VRKKEGHVLPEDYLFLILEKEELKAAPRKKG
jgi:hypothetical protein